MCDRKEEDYLLEGGNSWWPPRWPLQGEGWLPGRPDLEKELGTFSSTFQPLGRGEGLGAWVRNWWCLHDQTSLNIPMWQCLGELPGWWKHTGAGRVAYPNSTAQTLLCLELFQTSPGVPLYPAVSLDHSSYPLQIKCKHKIYYLYAYWLIVYMCVYLNVWVICLSYFWGVSQGLLSNFWKINKILSQSVEKSGTRQASEAVYLIH